MCFKNHYFYIGNYDKSGYLDGIIAFLLFLIFEPAPKWSRFSFVCWEVNENVDVDVCENTRASCSSLDVRVDAHDTSM